MEIRSNRFDCLIVGAGVAGLAAGRSLAAAGHSVCVLDKSRGIGGRLATRRIEGERFDHGAQFFTAREPKFQNVVDQWVQSGVARPWFGDVGHPRYCGVTDMNSVAKGFADGLEVVREQKVERIERVEGRWIVSTQTQSFESLSVLLTCPAPQAVDLVEPSRDRIRNEFMDILEVIEYDKCITLMLLLKSEPRLSPDGILQFEPEEPIATLTETSVKGTTERPGLVIQSGAKFADEHYESFKEEIFSELVGALPIEGKLEVDGMSLQKWRFAKRRPHDLEQSFSSDAALGLWHAGDGYLAPRVEGAIQSGWRVADSIIEFLSALNRSSSKREGENRDAG